MLTLSGRLCKHRRQNTLHLLCKWFRLSTLKCIKTLIEIFVSLLILSCLLLCSGWEKCLTDFVEVETTKDRACDLADKWTHTFTWMPSSSLLMHQKLSASMFLRASSWRLDTSKFSTSSSGGDKGVRWERERERWWEMSTAETGGQVRENWR